MRFVIVLLFASSLVGRQSEPRDGADSKSHSDKKKDTPPNSPAASSLPSASHPRGVDKPSSNSEQQHREDEPQQIWKKAFAPETWSNWVLVMIGAGGGVFALRTLRALQQQVTANEISAKSALSQAEAAKVSADTANRSAALSEKALHLTERADILISAVTLSTHPGFGPLTEITLVFKNFGRTRASDVRAETRLYTTDHGKDGQVGPILETIVAAGDTFCCAFPPIGEWTSRETLERITDGSATLHYDAKVNYVDVFEIAHHTACSGTYYPDRCNFVVDSNQQAD